MNSYVCKYDRSNIGSSNKLLTEYLGAAFMKIWRLGVPNCAFVKINYSHIPDEWSIPNKCFIRDCFGSLYNRNYDDLTHFSENINRFQKTKYGYIEELLKVALFDIWLGNDDRNHNNYNLMIDLQNERRFIPIDHEALLNGTTYNRKIYEISYNESIIDTELVANLFNRKYFNQETIREIRNDFYLCCENSRGSFDRILKEVPISWNINLDLVNDKIQSQVFNPSWIKRSFSVFLEYVSIQFKK